MGFVHILKWAPEQVRGSCVYSVSFAPLGPDGTGGAIPSREVPTKEDLVRFLKDGMRLERSATQRALDEVEIEGSTSIPFVDLPEDRLRDLRLVSVP